MMGCCLSLLISWGISGKQELYFFLSLRLPLASEKGISLVNDENTIILSCQKETIVIILHEYLQTISESTFNKR